MTELICGKCGEKFNSENENDSDEYCLTCLKEMNATKYPEHEKLQKVRKESQAIGSFLEWICWTKKYHFAKYYRYMKGTYDVAPEDADDEDTYTELITEPFNIEGLLAEYFEIDLSTLDEEKRDMLEELRALNHKDLTNEAKTE